jgi:dihydrofolate synthase/folylpolyglutamate synthase
LEITNFSQAKDYLSKYYGINRSHEDIQNIRNILSDLGSPQLKYRVIHIAGTSGKTSTAYFTSALLSKTGAKTGLTISPTIIEVNERVQLNNMPLSEVEFCVLLTKFDALIKDKDFRLSFHEFMLAFALWCFAELEVDYAVVETFVGGLYDTTNVLDSQDKVCIITDIGLDHMELLGNSLDKIAAHKAGIIHKNNQVFMYNQGKLVDDVVKEQAEKVKADLNYVDSSNTLKIHRPSYQSRNWNLAFNAVSYIIKSDNLKSISDLDLVSTRLAYIPARLEELKFNNIKLILDAAHNPQEVRTLVISLKKLASGQKPLIICAYKEGNRAEEMINELKQLSDQIVLTSFKSYKGTNIRPTRFDDISKTNRNLKIENDYKKVLNNISPDQYPYVLITGSIYLVSQVGQYLRSNQPT